MPLGSNRKETLQRGYDWREKLGHLSSKTVSYLKFGKIVKNPDTLTLSLRGRGRAPLPYIRAALAVADRAGRRGLLTTGLRP